MKHALSSSTVATVAIAAAAYVETHGGNPDKYLDLALLAIGYTTASVIHKVKAKKR